MKKKENNGHGGQRKGAGRKGRFGNCSFKTMRIPDFMCPHVSAMLDMAASGTTSACRCRTVVPCRLPRPAKGNALLP